MCSSPRTGRRCTPDFPTRRFHHLVGESGLPPIRLHDLRHGAASLAHCAGVDLKTVQAQLGHSSIVLTADTYTSVLTDLLAYAAEATARLVLTAAARNPGHRHRGKRSLGKWGLLTVTDPAAAATTFNWLVMGAPLNEAMLLGDDAVPPPPARLREHAEEATRLFLAGHQSPRGVDPPARSWGSDGAPWSADADPPGGPASLS